MPERCISRQYGAVDTTDYYRNRARFKHPELKDEWIEAAIASPSAIETQPDGRVRYYWWVDEVDRYIRVVLDASARHNAFIDRGATRRFGTP